MHSFKRLHQSESKNRSYTVKPCENESLYWEEMFVTLADPLASNPSKICIGNLYRPPHTQVTQLISFIDYFNTTIAQFEARNETSYVCGDYNINLLLINENINCSRLGSLNVFLALDIYHPLLYLHDYLITVLL